MAGRLPYPSENWVTGEVENCLKGPSSKLRPVPRVLEGAYLPVMLVHKVMIMGFLSVLSPSAKLQNYTVRM